MVATPRSPGLPPGQTLRRGILVRCPVCGERKLFSGLFTMVEDCPRCGLHYERLEGHWLGALAVNTMVTFGIMFVALGIILVVAYPEFPIGTMLAVLLPIPTLLPLLLFRPTRTFWCAMDLLLRPLQPGEVHPEFMPAETTADKSR